MLRLIQDLRYALRQLRKSPGFTIVAAITLALGIAGTTAIFSVVDQVLLHSLPYPNSGRIVYVSQTDRKSGEGAAASPANYLDWVTENQVFSVVAASRGWQGNLGGERPERVRITTTTANFFPLFGVRPLLGRSLLPEDEKPGHDHVAVISYRLWKRRFNADRTLLDHDLTLNNERYTVIGVMPPNFTPDNHGELWVPSPWGVPAHPLVPNQDPRQFRSRNYLDVWARLQPGVTLQKASARMDGIARRLESRYPDDNRDVAIRLTSMQDSLVSDVRPVLYVLLAAVVFVLLIGCANVANLLLARGRDRSREVSIRAALGASRRRLVWQILNESLLLSLLGGVLGILLAAGAVPSLLTLAPAEIRALGAVGVNGEILGFGILLSLLTGILFGLAPALHVSRGNLNESLKEGERSTGRGGRTRSALVIAEVGLSLVLLIGAGLTIQSFVRVLRVDPGFDSSQVLIFSVGLPPSATPAQQDSFYRQVTDGLQELPGVRSAGAVSRLPLSGGNSSRSFKIPGNDQGYSADIRVSTPEYFQTLGIPIIKGRLLTRHDIAGSTPVVVVNEALAQGVFPGQDPIGKYLLDFGPGNEKLQIVGVVGNVRHVGLDTAPHFEAYLPFGQGHWPSAFVAVRTIIPDPLALVPAVQNAVWTVDKSVPLSEVRTMHDVIARSVLRRKFTMTLLGIFAALAVLLAAVGLYGVMSYSVSQRTHEIGIRMALGAQRTDVVKMVVSHGMALAGMGVVLGVAVSLMLTRLISRLLFGISATDPGTFFALAVLLMSLALLANYIPARRATKVAPMVALRYE